MARDASRALGFEVCLPVGRSFRATDIRAVDTSSMYVVSISLARQVIVWLGSRLLVGWAWFCGVVGACPRADAGQDPNFEQEHNDTLSLLCHQNLT
jgi:hypothetical protein